MNSHKEIKSVVVDNGSSTIKAGFAGDDTPQVKFPTRTGRPRTQSNWVGDSTRDIYVGCEASCKRGVLILEHPIERGVITNWDHMEMIWHHTLVSELRVDPEQCNVFLTDSVVDDVCRKKMVEIMLEKFGVWGVFVGMRSLLSLYSTGRVSGIVVQSGSRVTDAVPIHGSKVITEARERLNLGGAEISEYLSVLLRERGYCFTVSAQPPPGYRWSSMTELEEVETMKKKLCYVAADHNKEFEISRDGSLDRSIQLSQDCISMGSQRFRAPELLYNTALRYDLNFKGIHEAVCSSLMKCDASIHGELVSNIVLSGGNTMFPGFEERLRVELGRLVGPILCDAVKVHAPPEREYSSWIGGSLFASLGVMQDQWISRQEYEEFGYDVVLKKCSLLVQI